MTYYRIKGNEVGKLHKTDTCSTIPVESEVEQVKPKKVRPLDLCIRCFPYGEEVPTVGKRDPLV